MKNILLVLLLLPVHAATAGVDDIGLTAHDMFDNRIALGLSAKVQHRLLANMRAQMQATQAIVGLLAEENFAKAAKISRMKFGLNEEMRQIYDLSKNADFKDLGLAFHDSAAELEAALQTRDMKKSLQALRDTTAYCVQCHRKFRQ